MHPVEVTRSLPDISEAESLPPSGIVLPHDAMMMRNAVCSPSNHTTHEDSNVNEEARTPPRMTVTVLAGALAWPQYQM